MKHFNDRPARPIDRIGPTQGPVFNQTVDDAHRMERMGNYSLPTWVLH